MDKSPLAERIEDIMAQSCAARDTLAHHPEAGPYVDNWLPIPRPYAGDGDIRLIIIGQDPTVQRVEERAKIRTVLNLDKRGGLLRYLAGLCKDLGISLKENVYATNACKCFFTRPPTAIKSADLVDVLELSAPIWLPILRTELEQFPDALIVSLGQPVLSMLVRDGYAREMKDYWGYLPRWKAGDCKPMHAIEPAESTVGRRIFPFVHQPTIRGSRAAFYRERRSEYIEFIKRNH